MSPRFESFAATHVGRRSNNEDQYCHEPRLGLFAVADGVGGYEGGEIASALAVETLKAFIENDVRDPEGTWPCRGDWRRSHAENVLCAATELAHRAIDARRVGAHASMGSTLVAAHVVNGRAVVGHVGDSRAYLFRRGVLDALTTDHSLYAEMQAHGNAPPRSEFGFRNIITRALGMAGDHHPDVLTVDLAVNDTLVLCSDGLHDPLTHDQLREVLLREGSAEGACQALVAAALAAGGSDNVTVVVVKLVSP